MSCEFFRMGKKILLKKRTEQKYTANVPQAIPNVTNRENEITEFKFYLRLCSVLSDTFWKGLTPLLSIPLPDILIECFVTGMSW